ncbi:MAG: DUF3866 family protein, partial [Actinomycetia bacterium]|nr:DUF3866 family protein [Actinomycetes bacterium]
MINIEKGIVEEIIERVGNSQRLKVEIGEKKYKAINYNYLTGSAEKGDNVLLNTTAEDLKLGTGGYHFVLFNLTKGKTKNIDGHIMKLRYSPYQISCLSIEETKSPFHDVLKDKEEIDGMPVIISSLHSQLPSIVVALKKIKKDIKISYIQTDAGALPIDFSYIYSYLKDKGLIDVSITSEHSFGGEWEAINVYSGLLASKHVFKVDITVIGLGPGIVGTGTKY